MCGYTSRFVIPAKPWLLAFCVVMFLTSAGCSNLRYWWHNDKMVGPNYQEPAAPISGSWRDESSPQVRTDTTPNPDWWSLFGDPTIDQLVELAYQQNLSLQAAANRIAEARAQRNIAAANLLPQQQSAFFQFAHSQNSLNSAAAFPGVPLTIDDWSTGFDASWEIDLWGRIRRSVIAADAQLCAATYDYDFALLSVIGDVVATYIQIRSFDERLELARQNVKLQEGSLRIADTRFEQGRTSNLDVQQAKTNLADTKSLIPQLELGRRQSLNALSILLGMPTGEVDGLIEPGGKIPTVPDEVVAGIPAELLRRRPDIRSAERTLVALCQQIGIAEADLYPQFALSGTLGWQAGKFADLFQSSSFTGSIAPFFRWNILNYGRLKNNIRAQEAVFQQQVANYKNTVLAAQREVEDGLIDFIKSRERLKLANESAEANKESVRLAQALYKEGVEDFGRVFVVESGLVVVQDRVVQTRAAVALALVQTYKALGGGWEIHSAE